MFWKVKALTPIDPNLDPNPALTRLEPLPVGWMTIAAAYGDIVGYLCQACARWCRRWTRGVGRSWRTSSGRAGCWLWWSSSAQPLPSARC